MKRIIIGENDLQVRPEPNHNAIVGALEAGSNENYKTITMKCMNHLFQVSESGSPGDYFEKEETMSEPVLDTMHGWIMEQLVP